MNKPGRVSAGDLPYAGLLRPGEQVADLRLRGLRLLQDPRFFCFSEDAARLAEFAAAQSPKARTVCELGSGNGGLLLALWARLPQAQCVGLEILPANVDLARRSLQLNAGAPGLAEHCRFVLGDWRQAGRYFEPASFDLIVSNPPFWPRSQGRLSPVLERRAATHELFGGLAELIAPAAVLLNAGGKLGMLLAIERDEEAAALLAQAGLRLTKRREWGRRVLLLAEKAAI